MPRLSHGYPRAGPAWAKGMELANSTGFRATQRLRKLSAETLMLQGFPADDLLRRIGPAASHELGTHAAALPVLLALVCSSYFAVTWQTKADVPDLEALASSKEDLDFAKSLLKVPGSLGL